MAGPKHLWSGDWERDSASAEPEFVELRARPREDEAPAAPANIVRERRQRRFRDLSWIPRTVPVAFGATALFLVCMYGLISLFGGSTPASQSVAGTPPAPVLASNSTASTKGVTWLGMQIVTLSSGTAVIETVANGSEGDAAGLEPGDQIVMLNHRAISAATQISDAIKGLPKHASVQIQVQRGSTMVTTAVILAAPPSVSP
jgi:membrane-associated protease RseP (regulator of RpoE activity)